MLPRALLLAPLTAALIASIGCSGAPEAHDEGEGSPGEPTGSTSEPLTTITRSEVIGYAEQWVQAKLQYCQSPYGQPDPDTACSATCERQSETAWNPYRSDCSGFVSWAWQLPAPGRVTSTFAPFDTAVSNSIQCTDLKPGDAANRNSGGHMVLFKQWVTPGKEAIFAEEPGCSSSEPYAREFTSTVTCSGVNVDITYEGATFTAIRFDDVVDDPPDAGAGDGAVASGGDSGAKGGGDAGLGGDDGGGAVATGSGSGSGNANGGAATSGDAGSGPTVWDTSAGTTGCDVGAAPGREPSGLGALVILGLALLGRRSRR